MSICSVPDVAVRADVESPCSVTFAATPACRVKAPLSAIDAPGPFWQEVTLARAVAGSTKSPLKGPRLSPQAPSETSPVKGRPPPSTIWRDSDGSPQIVDGGRRPLTEIGRAHV